jgi:hypothetical protein
MAGPTCNRPAFCLQGYDEFVGRTAEIIVTRSGAVTGRAAAEITAGDPSFEVNHPGGA